MLNQNQHNFDLLVFFLLFSVKTDHGWEIPSEKCTWWLYLWNIVYDTTTDIPINPLLPSTFDLISSTASWDFLNISFNLLGDIVIVTEWCKKPFNSMGVNIQRERVWSYQLYKEQIELETISFHKMQVKSIKKAHTSRNSIYSTRQITS